MQRRMEQIDSETGEVLEGFVAYVVPKKTNGFGKRWLAMSQDAMLWLSRGGMDSLVKEAGAEELRVFFCLLSYVDYENYILTPQSEMAKKIGMNRASFNRAVKRLVERNVIEKGPKIGRIVSLKLNASYGWKGSAKNHHNALKERMDNAGLSVINGNKGGAEEEQTQLDI